MNLKMARSKRQYYTSILLIAIIDLLCLDSIAMGKSHEMVAQIESPPSVFNLGEAVYYVSPLSKVNALS
jgi:hypothetical protein